MNGPLLVLFACALAAAFALSPAGAQSTSQSAFTVGTQKVGVLMPPSPVGMVLMIPGGSTKSRIDADGTVGPDSRAQAFPVNVRGLFAKEGYASAVIDDPGDVAAVVAQLRAKFGVAVYLMGMSRGTILAAEVAPSLNGAIAGLILASSVTVSSPRYPSATALDARLGSITVPVLVMANGNDACKVSPPSGAQQIAASLKSAASVETATFVSTQVLGDNPCEPPTPHTYTGIETTVVARIAEWMHAHQPATPASTARPLPTAS